MEPSHPFLAERRNTRLSRTKRAINTRAGLPTRPLLSTPSAEIAHLESRPISTTWRKLTSNGRGAWAQVLHLVHLKRRPLDRCRLNLEPSHPCLVERRNTRLSRTAKQAIRSRGGLLVHRLPSMPTARSAHLASRPIFTIGLRRISRGLSEPEASLRCVYHPTYHTVTDAHAPCK